MDGILAHVGVILLKFHPARGVSPVLLGVVAGDAAYVCGFLFGTFKGDYDPVRFASLCHGLLYYRTATSWLYFAASVPCLRAFFMVA